ncbi:MAG: hypothetical protein MHM6MM_000021 [Cercozoa sp. M6MM]
MTRGRGGGRGRGGRGRGRGRSRGRGRGGGRGGRGGRGNREMEQLLANYQLPNFEEPGAIEQWVAERRKRFPTLERIKQRKREAAALSAERKQMAAEHRERLREHKREAAPKPKRRRVGTRLEAIEPRPPKLLHTLLQQERERECALILQALRHVAERHGLLRIDVEAHERRVAAEEARKARLQPKPADAPAVSALAFTASNANTASRNSSDTPTVASGPHKDDDDRPPSELSSRPLVEYSDSDSDSDSDLEPESSGKN